MNNSISDIFHENILLTNEMNNHDFMLTKVTDYFYTGIDKENNVVIVGLSNKPNRYPIMQKTRLLSLECNASVTYVIDEELKTNTVHIVRCFAKTNKERDIFLELSSLFLSAFQSKEQEETIMETFSILDSFFANNVEPSDAELQGLYAELYSIWMFKEYIDLAKYWQSRDRMKFDFSISEKVKVEVKSTIKNERKHHFRHEQLEANIFNIYIISYLLRHDDEGLSLEELIANVKPLFNGNIDKLLIIDRFVKNTSQSRLSNFKFNETLLKEKYKIFRVEDIPKFSEKSPSGVSNAEYDCNLERVNSILEEDFIAELNSWING